MKNVLLINAHQLYAGFADGKLNKTLIETATSQLHDRGFEIKTVTLENGYDVEEEVKKILWADAIFLQAPVYWMGAPYILKKYIDEVYTTGFADGRFVNQSGGNEYGRNGLLTEKQYMISTTWNAKLDAINDEKQFLEGIGIDGLFVWLHKVFQYCGMKAMPSFSCNDVIKNPTVEDDINRLKQHLEVSFIA